MSRSLGRALLAALCEERTALSVARQTGVSKTAIVDAKNGRCQPRLAHALVYRDVLGIPVDAWGASKVAFATAVRCKLSAMNPNELRQALETFIAARTPGDRQRAKDQLLAILDDAETLGANGGAGDVSGQRKILPSRDEATPSDMQRGSSKFVGHTLRRGLQGTELARMNAAMGMPSGGPPQFERDASGGLTTRYRRRAGR